MIEMRFSGLNIRTMFEVFAHLLDASLKQPFWRSFRHQHHFEILYKFLHFLKHTKQRT